MSNCGIGRSHSGFVGRGRGARPSGTRGVLKLDTEESPIAEAINTTGKRGKSRPKEKIISGKVQV